MLFDSLTLPTQQFRDVGFCERSLSVERRSDNALILRSERSLPSLPGCVTDWLAHWVTVRPNNPMLVERDRDGIWKTWTCADVWSAVRSIASCLVELDMDQNSPIVILSENSVHQALITWGALYVGFPVAPVSPAYSLLTADFSRLVAAVELVRPGLIFVQDAKRFEGPLVALNMPAERIVAVENVGSNMLSFAEWTTKDPDTRIDDIHRSLIGSQPAKYMFTSGSTGIPKAVVQTRGMLAAAQEMTARVFERDPEEAPTYLEWLPWHHVMGGSIVLNRILRFGATLYLDEGRPVPGRFEATLKNLREVAPSLYFNVPAGLTMLVSALEKDDELAINFFSKLKYVYYGGAVLPKSTYDRFQQVAKRITGEKIVLTSVYGATETSGPAVTQYWGADDVGCIGLPLSGVALKLTEDASVPGRYEMRIKGPNIIQEYLNAPQQTRDAFDDEGYYITGDAVRFVDEHDPYSGLKFAGRFAEDFKLSNGTWVRTAALRTRLLEAFNPLIKEAVIVSNGNDMIGALVWPDLLSCSREMGGNVELSAGDIQHNEALRLAMSVRLQQLNSGQQGASMRIERVTLLSEPPSMAAYELTDKGSINQRAVMVRRSKDIDAMFVDPCPPNIVKAIR